MCGSNFEGLISKKLSIVICLCICTFQRIVEAPNKKIYFIFQLYKTCLNIVIHEYRFSHKTIYSYMYE